MPIALEAADIWTPPSERDAHLARTIICINYTTKGEIVEYVTPKSDGPLPCKGETFRQWVSKVRATRTVHQELKNLIDAESAT